MKPTAKIVKLCLSTIMFAGLLSASIVSAQIVPAQYWYYAADWYSGEIYFCGNNVTTSYVNSGGEPEGLAMDFFPSDYYGDLFISDSSGNRIEVATPVRPYGYSGTVTNFATGLDNPNGLAFDSRGSLYEADWGSGTIYEFAEFVVPPNPPTWTKITYATNLDHPCQMAFDTNDNLYVSDNYGTTITKIAAGTRIETTFASNLNGPAGLVFDSAGNLYEADAGTGDINEFVNNNGTLSSTPVVFASGLDGPAGLAIDGYGDLYVTEQNLGDVVTIGPDGYEYVQDTGLGLTTAVASWGYIPIVRIRQ